MRANRDHFTLEALDWDPWLDVVSLDEASETQREVLNEVAIAGEVLPFYGVLAHDAEALRQRMRLYKAIMYGRSGLSRADRELVGTVVSCRNGCVYCTSNHGRLFVRLTKQKELARSVIDDFRKADLDQRRRAMLAFAVRLTESPASVTDEDIDSLRSAGLSDLDIFDLCHVTAMFAWANRLAEGLGEVER